MANVAFRALGVKNEIVEGLEASKIYVPTPIQKKAIPALNRGADVIVNAAPGAGKSTLITIRALEILDLTVLIPQVIIIVPMREMALEIKNSITSIGRNFLWLRVTYCIGGTSFTEDLRQVKRCHILIATPGRLIHLFLARCLDIKAVRLVVFDDAVALMKEIFESHIYAIFRHLPRERQVLALTTSYSDDLQEFLNPYMSSPMSITDDSPVCKKIQQLIAIVPGCTRLYDEVHRKIEELCNFISQIPFRQCVVFLKFPSYVQTIRSRLSEHGWNSVYLSWSQPLANRVNRITKIKKRQFKIVLVTDPSVLMLVSLNADLAVNFEVPMDGRSYLKRMERIGAHINIGRFLTLVSNSKDFGRLWDVIQAVNGFRVVFPAKPFTVDDIVEIDAHHFQQLQRAFARNNASINLRDPEKFDLEYAKNPSGSLNPDSATDDNERPIKKRKLSVDTSTAVNRSLFKAVAFYNNVPVANNFKPITGAQGDSNTQTFKYVIPRISAGPRRPRESQSVPLCNNFKMLLKDTEGSKKKRTMTGDDVAQTSSNESTRSSLSYEGNYDVEIELKLISAATSDASSNEDDEDLDNVEALKAAEGGRTEEPLRPVT